VSEDILKDWKTMAKGVGLEITGPDLDRIVQSLSALDETFRPLLKDLGPEIEPATVFHAGETGA
jgi:hypothetical protein